MNSQSRQGAGQRQSRHRKRALDLLMTCMLVLGVLFPVSAAAPVAAAAPPKIAAVQSGFLAAPAQSVLTLQVVSARDEPRHTDPDTGDPAPVQVGDPVSTYEFIIVEDNTGDPFHARYPDCYPYLDPGTNTVPNPAYPNSCPWPSIRAVPGYSPIVTQGNQDDVAAGITLPDGKYVISVVARGYKLGGAHFSVPLTGAVIVKLQPHPLPTATIRIKLFWDQLANGQFDAPLEAAPPPEGWAGFTPVIGDIAGQVVVDAYNNPLCTQYEVDAQGNVIFDADGNPIPIPGTGGQCLPDANGIITIPYLWPNRYEVFVNPPAGGGWVQTTTLEGAYGWDTWLQEGGTGWDNEFVVAGEQFPWTIVGYTKPLDMLNDPGVTGKIKGQIVDVTVYTPFMGGLPYYGQQWGGLSGAKIIGPIRNPWIALNNLLGGDTSVYVGQGDENGFFEITNVPDGDYLLTYWDPELFHILDFVQVSVVGGQTVDIGKPFLTGWFNRVEGHVFVDENENGKRDPGEPGVPEYPLVLRRRDNAEMDRMSIATVTDHSGYYAFERVYPLTSWIVLEAYHDLYRVTGVTYQVENQPTPTTILGNGVDVGLLPIIGQSGWIDWGVKPYDKGTNGGIVGTVFYDPSRNELDARYAAVEPYAPGIPNLTVKLYTAAKDANGNFLFEPDGSYKKGYLLGVQQTESWTRPNNCVARDINGNPVQQLSLPVPSAGNPYPDCLEGPLVGMQFGFDYNAPDGPGFQTVDGNFGFTEVLTDPVTGISLTEPIPLPAGDYLVEAVIPNDPVLGRPLYQVTREEDVNVFTGDQYRPAPPEAPEIPPPPCAGPLHVVDVAGIGPDGPNAVANPDFVAEGGSPYEGQEMPLCNVKLVQLTNGKSIAPTFNLFTNVPVPGRWKGYIIDDLTLSTDPKDLFFGEKAGVPNSPIGIYEFTMQKYRTIHSDPNGTFEVLLPSTNTFNVPSPTGVAPNLWYILGNDPGQPGDLNPAYNPQYRTIGTSFEIWPGVGDPADLAPIQNATGILFPGSQVQEPPQCRVAADTPQLFAVSQPYARRNTALTLTIRGLGFGVKGPNSKISLDAFQIPDALITNWDDRTIVINFPSSSTFWQNLPAKPYQLMITRDNGQPLTNGLTFHVLGAGYNPQLYEVGPGRAYTTIQAAIDAALGNAQRDLVVVWPGQPTQWNPTGDYYENPVIYDPIKLQGIGPGGLYTDTLEYVPGSVINGLTMTGDTAYSEQWRAFVQGLQWSGNPNFSEGQVIYILARQGRFTSVFRASVDGFTITGGDQQGFQQPGQAEIQGGGIYVHGYANYLQITNNIIRGNGGTYGGAIRLGTPDWGDNQNDAIRIANNQILANGSSNLAGALGIFRGADNYEVAYNHICGNFSAEYGGGISHYGYSPGGKIHHNRIYFNSSYDEGGGIMIAGELPATPNTLSPGAGPVDIYNNVIQANLANDDGGGVRFLMAGNFPFNVYNNIIVNNVSTHEGGGISLNDAPNVRIYNNTIMKNITTSTAMTSDGQPNPAGISTSLNSALLQATLPAGSKPYSNPLLFNNILWDNRAGSWDGTSMSGIGLPGDPSPIQYWDMGVANSTYLLEPTNSLFQVSTGTAPSPTNLVGVDPQVIQTYDLSLVVLPWRGDPNFVGVWMVAVDLPPTLMGNYHLQGTSPAIDQGAASKGGINAPTTDIDDDPRPAGAAVDIGADEIGPLNNVAVVLPGTAFGAVRWIEALITQFYLPLITKSGSQP